MIASKTVKKRFFIIEQSPTLSVILSSQLRIAGHLCIVCSGYQESVTNLRKIPEEPPHFIFIAIHANPVYMDWLKAMQEICPYAQIVVMVPQEERNLDVAKAIIREIQPLVLEKPFTVKQILEIASRPVSMEGKNKR